MSCQSRIGRSHDAFGAVLNAIWTCFTIYNRAPLGFVAANDMEHQVATSTLADVVLRDIDEEV